MYREKSICVVVPAYNEEKLIGQTLGSIPAYVDHIVVVDDASSDDTAKIVDQIGAQDPRVELIRYP